MSKTHLEKLAEEHAYLMASDSGSDWERHYASFISGYNARKAEEEKEDESKH